MSLQSPSEFKKPKLNENGSIMVQTGSEVTDVLNSIENLVNQDKVFDVIVNSGSEYAETFTIHGVGEKEVAENVNEKLERSTKLVVEFTNIDDADLKELQKMFGFMNFCAGAGASREIKVFVDGDGAFRAKIKMTPEPTKEDYEKMSDSDVTDISLGC